MKNVVTFSGFFNKAICKSVKALKLVNWLTMCRMRGLCEAYYASTGRSLYYCNCCERYECYDRCESRFCLLRIVTINVEKASLLALFVVFLIN